MKLMWKLLLAVLVISMLLPFTLLKDDTGSTLLKFSDLEWPDWPKLTKILPKTVDSKADSIYQWVDAEGNLQYSNSLPPEGIEYTVRNYVPNLNVIQSINTKSDGLDEAEDTPNKDITTGDDIVSPYSTDGIKKLFEDVNNVEKLLNQRSQKQKAAIGQ